MHDYESPAQHTAHLDAEDKRKKDSTFTEWQRQYDYQHAHPRPVRIQGARLVQDDPSLPLGAQRYITQIATKHGGDLDAAF